MNSETLRLRRQQKIMIKNHRDLIEVVAQLTERVNQLEKQANSSPATWVGRP